MAWARGQVELASRAYQQVLSRNRNHLPAVAKLADCLTELGEYASALALYQSLRGRFGETAALDRKIGRAQMLSGDLTGTIDTLTELHL